MPDPALFKRSKLPPEQLALARRLRADRLHGKFSLAELARECLITKSALVHYEYGAAPLPFAAGNDLCRRLNLNQQWLCTGQGTNRPFVELLDLTSDSALLRAAERLNFLEAYTGPLRKPLEAWHSKNPMPVLVKKSLVQGMDIHLPRFSEARLKVFLSDQLRFLKKAHEPTVRLSIIGMIKMGLDELEARIRRQKYARPNVSVEKPIDDTTHIGHLTPVQISERLKEKRAALGITQAQAAERWGVSIRTLQKWEQGSNKPRGLALRQLEMILRDASQSSDCAT